MSKDSCGTPSLEQSRTPSTSSFEATQSWLNRLRDDETVSIGQVRESRHLFDSLNSRFAFRSARLDVVGQHWANGNKLPVMCLSLTAGRTVTIVYRENRSDVAVAVHVSETSAESAVADLISTVLLRHQIEGDRTENAYFDGFPSWALERPLVGGVLHTRSFMVFTWLVVDLLAALETLDTAPAAEAPPPVDPDIAAIADELSVNRTLALAICEDCIAKMTDAIVRRQVAISLQAYSGSAQRRASGPGEEVK